ncbi:MAG TPA: hypothetical protein VNT60_02615 [Deinococcales bacterium]|nr:hypothetical protein [Deinococcales bacterium]
MDVLPVIGGLGAAAVFLLGAAGFSSYRRWLKSKHLRERPYDR